MHNEHTLQSVHYTHTNTHTNTHTRTHTHAHTFVLHSSLFHWQQLEECAEEQCECVRRCPRPGNGQKCANYSSVQWLSCVVNQSNAVLWIMDDWFKVEGKWRTMPQLCWTHLSPAAVNSTMLCRYIETWESILLLVEHLCFEHIYWLCPLSSH